jgi:hypothetical protein
MAGIHLTLGATQASAALGARIARLAHPEPALREIGEQLLPGSDWRWTAIFDRDPMRGDEAAVAHALAQLRDPAPSAELGCRAIEWTAELDARAVLPGSVAVRRGRARDKAPYQPALAHRARQPR